MSFKPQFGTGGQLKITRGALYLLIAEVGLSLLYLMSGDEMKGELAAWLGASADSVWYNGKVWTLATSAFLQPQFITLLFDALILWMFLPTIERWWGTKRFLKFALWTSLAGMTAGTLVGLALGTPHAVVGGLSPFIYGGIVAFGILYATQQVQFFGVLPMTGRQLTIGICVFVGLFIVIGQQWTEGASYAGGMLMSWLLVNGKWTPKLWWLRRKQKKLRRHLKVVRDENDKKWLN